MRRPGLVRIPRSLVRARAGSAVSGESSARGGEAEAAEAEAAEAEAAEVEAKRGAGSGGRHACCARARSLASSSRPSLKMVVLSSLCTHLTTLSRDNACTRDCHQTGAHASLGWAYSWATWLSRRRGEMGARGGLRAPWGRGRADAAS